MELFAVAAPVLGVTYIILIIAGIVVLSYAAVLIAKNYAASKDALKK